MKLQIGLTALQSEEVVLDETGRGGAATRDGVEGLGGARFRWCRSMLSQPKIELQSGGPFFGQNGSK